MTSRFLEGDHARFFNDEIHPELKHSKTGTVAMASSGENLNASQVSQNEGPVDQLLRCRMSSCDFSVLFSVLYHTLR